MDSFKCDYCGQDIRPEDEIIENGIHYHVACYNALCSEDEFIMGRCCTCSDWVHSIDAVIINKTRAIAHSTCI